MANWLESMQQTFEYYTVDPNTWKDAEKLTNVKSCTITRDSEASTLGSATIDVTESIGESYVRVYLITLQNGVREKHPLGTFLVQTPASSFNGKIRNVTLDAYTPLLELKEKSTPLGYSLLEGDNVMKKAYQLTRENARAPVVEATSDITITSENGFVSNTGETWVSFISTLINDYAEYHFDLDELGRILFAPKQELASLQPVWTYDDSEQSILYHDVSLDHDLYGIPNVVEVVCSAGGTAANEIYYSRVVNDDKNSPVSTIARGREIVYPVTDPKFKGAPTQEMVDLYASQVLKEVSTMEYTVSYTHGYCGTRVGDCVRLNYSRAGFTDVKAKIISQSIKCVPGCPVTEKAVFTSKLWR